MIIEGQLHWGAAQGTAKALQEIVYDRDTGQLLTGSLPQGP